MKSQDTSDAPVIYLFYTAHYLDLLNLPVDLSNYLLPAHFFNASLMTL